MIAFLVPLAFAIALLVAKWDEPWTGSSQVVWPIDEISKLEETKKKFNEVVGTASIVDGDTLEIHGLRIRLSGVDAPETGQTCRRGGELYRCGRQAALALSDFVGKGIVLCKPNGRDRYGRLIAVCTSGGTDLGGWLVNRGLAVAYRKYDATYIDAEERAKWADLGIWDGEFIQPEDWRRGDRF